MNVLVLEDSEAMVGMIVKALKNGGLPVREIYQAASGMEGLQWLRDHPVDLVFMDLNMSAEEGEDFLRSVRGESATPGVPVVVVSSDTSSRWVGGLEALGATVVQKPFTAQTLRTAAETALGVRQ